MLGIYHDLTTPRTCVVPMDQGKEHIPDLCKSRSVGSDRIQ